MAQAFQDYDRSFYNALPGIEQIDSTVRTSGQLQKALSVAGPLFARYGLCDTWGISLLHSHWYVEADQLPIQRVQDGPSGAEFITRPRLVPVGEPVWPSLLAVVGSGLQPLEFSTDDHVRSANAALASRPQFVTDFSSLVVHEGLCDAFGLIVVRQPADPAYEFVEFNRDGSSILRPMLSAQVSRTNLIETSWRFRPDILSASCESSCFATCTKTDGGHTKNPHRKAHKPG